MIKRIACCFVVTALLAGFAARAIGQTIRLEAEDAELIGVRAIRPGQPTSAATTTPTTATSSAPATAPVRRNFSGKGFVTGFETSAGQLIVHIRDAKPGLYSLRFGYTATSAIKQFEVVVNNDLRIYGLLPQTDQTFRPHAAGRVELGAGDNTIRFERGWGYYDLDYIELEPVPLPPPPKHVARTLVDPKATPEARDVFARLCDAYGRETLSGVYSREDAELVRKVSGNLPAIMGGDLMDYSPSRIEYGVEKKNTSEELIALAREGYLLTVSWHWNAPSGLLDKMITGPDGNQVDARWYKGFNTNATTFDLSNAIADERSEDYRLLVRDIDAIAIQLRKFEKAKVPILWRPLHEAEGKWFWWGATGAEPYVKLWRLMHDRLTNHHQLHNLIWVYTGGVDHSWYPGDAFVDVVGIDAYPPDVRDPLSEFWDAVRAQYSDRKLLALSEFGGVPDIERMRRHGVYWSYFTSWTGQSGPAKMKADDLRKIYLSPNVKNRTR
ncbi:glycosyl hydrolase [soil metagenome]